MRTPDVIGTATQERWAWTNTDLNAVIDRLWNAYANGATVDLTPQQLRATLVTLADGVRRMEDDFWSDAHAA